MNQRNFIAYVCIGIGLYFFLTQFSHPLIKLLQTLSVWVILVGLIFLFNYIKEKNASSLVQGLSILLIGVHMYGVDYIQGWLHHWAMYPLAVGIAFLLTSLVTKKAMIPSIMLIAFSLLFIFDEKLPDWFPSFTQIDLQIDEHWPLLLIGIGIILLFFKRK